NDQRPALEQALAAARAANDSNKLEVAEKASHTNRVQEFNNILDAIVAAVFMALVAAIFLLSAREWLLLLGRRKLAQLRETEPVWLPEYATAETRSLSAAGLVALGLTLAKELTGEAQMERAAQTASAQASEQAGSPSDQAKQPNTSARAGQ